MAPFVETDSTSCSVLLVEYPLTRNNAAALFPRRNLSAGGRLMSPWLQGPCKKGSSLRPRSVCRRGSGSLFAADAYYQARDAHARLEISFAGTRERVYCFARSLLGLIECLTVTGVGPSSDHWNASRVCLDDVAFASPRVAGIFHFAFTIPGS